MFKILCYYTLLIQKCMLSLLKGNSMFFLVFEVFCLIPFKAWH